MKSKTEKKINDIKIWLRLGFSLPEDAEVFIQESDGEETDNRLTKIEIEFSHGEPQQFEIPKPLDRVSRRDIYKLVAKKMDEKGEKRSVMGKVIRFFAWWFGFSSLYAMFAVCPFCGQIGCPVGMGSVGFVGGFFALLMQDWKSMVGFFRTRFSRTGRA